MSVPEEVTGQWRNGGPLVMLTSGAAGRVAGGSCVSGCSAARNDAERALQRRIFAIIQLSKKETSWRDKDVTGYFST